MKELQGPCLESQPRVAANGCPVASQEPQAAFEVLEPSQVDRMRVEELHHRSPEVSEPQLTQASALRKALHTPGVEGLLAKLQEALI